MRPMFVRLQLDRDGRTTNYSRGGRGRRRASCSNVRRTSMLAGIAFASSASQYRISLSLFGEGGRASGAALLGNLTLDAAPGRSLPPAAIHGARGWVSGYVVPVLSGTFHGTLHVGGDDVSVDGAAGYHDHNWGFWEGVRWQWGQVARRRRLHRLRPRVPACGGCRCDAHPRLSRRPRTRRPDRVFNRRVDHRRRRGRQAEADHGSGARPRRWS